MNSTSKPALPLTPGLWRGGWYAVDTEPYPRNAWVLDVIGPNFLSAWCMYTGEMIVVDYSQHDPCRPEYPRVVAGPFETWQALEAAVVLMVDE